jgi:hypothetical protein
MLQNVKSWVFVRHMMNSIKLFFFCLFFSRNFIHY